MNRTENWNKIFDSVISEYHKADCVDSKSDNPYPASTLEHLLFAKNWIDTVQWHLEDIIRDPNIDPITALQIKRRIDKSNQDRTDMVEYIDSYMLELYKNVATKESARVNSETPAWAIDRLSILALKIYHMRAECQRIDVDQDHITQCSKKLDTLLEQRVDLSTSIDQLLDDIESGDKYMKVYKQMKMYNDPSLNPVLYANGEAE